MASRSNVAATTQNSAAASTVRMSMKSQGSINSARSTEPARALVSAGIELVVEEEDMEFTMFVAGLQQEVAGNHIELWSGFQTILGRPKQHQVLLHEAHVDEKSVESHNRDGKKKQKKAKMDPQTRASLTTIHTHLMENGRVKEKLMTTSSQLVNDKKVKKDCEEKRLVTSRVLQNASIIVRHNNRHQQANNDQLMRSRSSSGGMNSTRLRSRSRNISIGSSRLRSSLSSGGAFLSPPTSNAYQQQ